MLPGNTTGPDGRGRILVVDDELHVREGLCWCLRNLGYAPEVSGGVDVALARIPEEPFDLMLLDLSIPGIDIADVLERARDGCSELRIIVMASSDTMDEAALAVCCGVDGWLLKPVSVDDLSATVESVLAPRSSVPLPESQATVDHGFASDDRPAEPSGPSRLARETMTAGHLSLDPVRRMVMIASDPPRTAALTRGETAVLAGLMRHPGQMRSAGQIARDGWGYQMVESAAARMVRPHIYRLRKKIESWPDRPVLIRTVRGGGYLLAVPGSRPEQDKANRRLRSG